MCCPLCHEYCHKTRMYFPFTITCCDNCIYFEGNHKLCMLEHRETYKLSQEWFQTETSYNIINPLIINTMKLAKRRQL